MLNIPKFGRFYNSSHQLLSQTFSSMIGSDDDIEDERLEYRIGQNPRKCDETSIGFFPQCKNEVRMLQDSFYFA